MLKTEVMEEKRFDSKEMVQVGQASRTIGDNVKRHVRRGTGKGSMDAKKRGTANSLETRDARSKHSRGRGNNRKGNGERAMSVREGMAHRAQSKGGDGQGRGGRGGKGSREGRDGTPVCKGPDGSHQGGQGGVEGAGEGAKEGWWERRGALGGRPRGQIRTCSMQPQLALARVDSL